MRTWVGDDIVPAVPAVPRRLVAEDGTSLLGLTIVLAVLGGLAVMALSATGFHEDVQPLELTSPQPAEGAPPVRQAPGDHARRVACEANLRAVEAAVATKQAVEGSLPVTIEELAAGGWLSDPAIAAETDISLELRDGVPTGRVLVAGRPGLEGCGTT
jgi:hypothetical protein